MRSLLCVRHSNWDGALNFIQTEGGKAGRGTIFSSIHDYPPCRLLTSLLDWVQDKKRSGFAFEGMCWERSRIPLVIWQSGESNTNLIETVHADVNREGTECTLVGGVTKGRFFDSLKHKSILVCY
jgi:hypothetical protein